MKSVTKFLLAGLVVAAAVAVSAAPSEAAKRKMAAGRCNTLGHCSVCAKDKTCEVMHCDGTGKLYRSVLGPYCMQPNCPQKC